MIDKNLDIWARFGDRLHNISKGDVYDLSGAQFMIEKFSIVAQIQNDEDLIEKFEEVKEELTPEYLEWLKKAIDFSLVQSPQQDMDIEV